MSRGPQHISAPGISSRRSACDRCRAQKLRCLRERPEQDRCNRCLRAHTPCLTTPDPISRVDSGRWELEIPASMRTPISAVGSVSMSASTESLTPSTWEGSWLSLAGDETESFVGTAFSSAGCNEEWDIRSKVFNETAFSEEGFQADFKFATLATAVYDDSTEGSLSYPHSLLPPSSSSSRSSAPSSRRSSTEHPRVRSERHETPLPSVPEFESAATAHGRSPEDRRDPHSKEMYTERLSNLNSDLIKQLSVLDHCGILSLSLGMLVAPSSQRIANPVSDIMRSASEFFRIIKLPSDRGYTTVVTNSDPATLLLALTCYVHLLRAYVILFESLCSWLKGVADSDDPSLHHIPGLCNSHLSLGSGNLQATFFIQAAIDLFERIETLLGLPAACRLDPQGKNGGGILGSVEFRAVIDVIISEEEKWHPAHGETPGGIKTLRRSIKWARELLRDSISP
ncbi:hypothetical protein B0H63DRAFT_180244 [Podospora didyma]|uniref:Zn(2)-C6 fungal-type domain-containing protein n=1 Tax=Podospora didyma TaxID=330526 RepID=A0AAE0NPA2_9PEZI|nr:hypothetical protein B0H63DRAFT_180244 [Podospora didyma]